MIKTALLKKNPDQIHHQVQKQVNASEMKWFQPALTHQKLVNMVLGTVPTPFISSIMCLHMLFIKAKLLSY